ncbi:unnamed protein product [Brachionus calyciflorus]|uniref:Snake toxin/toxin-like domain-containing protein n=1 Tax=Brachionus calyciflorus TaxID=104777 RepID=A0A814DY05_9BILA|nr:unnamed protein product [Brachionus calyciflorus]
MKLSFISSCLFVFILSYVSVKSNALMCHECLLCISSELGVNRTCPETATYCQKIRTYGGSMESVQRLCADTCIETKISALGAAGTETTCCTTDFYSVLTIKIIK